MTAAQTMKDETARWLKSLVIDHNLCPFAHKDYAQNRIYYAVMAEANDNAYYDSVVNEVDRMIVTHDISTTLLLWPAAQSFDNFINLVAMAEHILTSHGWQNDIQLAHFHPNYCFADTDENDAANYTNRSPYPMLHLLRAENMARVLSKYPNPENIPARNIEHTRTLGTKQLIDILNNCKSPVGQT